jgi:hypothetical protein
VTSHSELPVSKQLQLEPVESGKYLRHDSQTELIGSMWQPNAFFPAEQLAENVPTLTTFIIS